MILFKIARCNLTGYDAITNNESAVTSLSYLGIVGNNHQSLPTLLGKTKEKSSSIRMSVDGVGHNVSLKPTFEDKPTINVISYDVESITKRLENLGVKMIDNKKK